MIQNTIEQHIKPTIEAMGYELWGCQYLAQGRYALLRVYIDREAGIGIEDCEQVSRQISALLDVEDPISGQYSLEVSSPGIPRPLFYPYQYARYVGESVEVKLAKPLHNQRKFIGTIVSADDQVLVLDAENGSQDFHFTNIVKAHLISK